MAGFCRTKRMAATSVAMIFFSYDRTSACFGGAILRITSRPSASWMLYAALNQPSFSSRTASSPFASAGPPKAAATMVAICARVLVFLVLLSIASFTLAPLPGNALAYDRQHRANTLIEPARELRDLRARLAHKCRVFEHRQV